jgi:HrpA-like RNA helicase
MDSRRPDFGDELLAGLDYFSAASVRRQHRSAGGFVWTLDLEMETFLAARQRGRRYPDISTTKMATEQSKASAKAPAKSTNSQTNGVKRKRADGPPKTNNPLHNKKIKLLESRKKLPIWARQQDIKKQLQENDVLVLSGETGSGKSTQLPQFLLETKWCTKCIAVTQPRRVAAISLARRVAEEMGTPLGNSSPASKVGYSVRFDDSTSPSTRIKYLTEGMLLQEMLRDSAMSQYSCVVVDEVHERSVNVDLILGFLKGLVAGINKKRKTPLKVVIMSATADVEGIARFFGEPMPSGDVLGGGDDDATEVAEKKNEVAKQPPAPSKPVSSLHVEGRQYPVKLSYLDRPTDDVLQSAFERIFQIHCKEPMPGDILVFLTGQETIQSLQKLLEEYANNLTADSTCSTAHIPVSSSKHSQGHTLHKHRRNLRHRSWRPLCRRHRQSQDQAIPQPPRPRLPPHQTHLSLLSGPTQRSCRS